MITAYFDGACEPVNPGGTGSFGILIYKDKTLLHKDYRVIGSGAGISNNVAEYEALTAALNWVGENVGYDEPIVVKGDSKLVINQMDGQWNINEGLYVPYAKAARLLTQKFSNISFVWVPRDFNEEADNLSKAALIDSGVRIAKR